MSVNQILVSGFGGQGILFAGKILAYAGMLAGKQVSWLPSYGPEMRGGTACCHVIISDEPVASPIITEADTLIALNLPSLDKFEEIVRESGAVIYDSSLINRNLRKNGINEYPIPATQIAMDMKTPNLANMIAVGKFLTVTDILTYEDIEKSMMKNVPAGKQDLIELNLNAIKAGMEI